MEHTPQSFETRQRMCRNDFEIFHYRDKQPGCVELHHHDFYEIYFFLGGDVEYRVEGKSYRLQKGDLLLINPMELHQPMAMSGCNTYERIVLWINRDYLAAQDIELSRCFAPTHKNLLRPSREQFREIRAKIDNLIRERRDNALGSEACATGIFLQLMVELNRMALQADSQGQETQPLTTQVVAYIGRHYREPLSLDGLAKSFFVSKYHLSHKFTQATGVSVYHYIVMKRLQAARQLLLDGHTPKDAFVQSGFGDYANFYRAFHRAYGVTPQMFAEKSTTI